MYVVMAIYKNAYYTDVGMVSLTYIDLSTLSAYALDTS